MRNRKSLKGLVVITVFSFFLSSCALPPPGTPLTPEQRERAKNQCIAQYTVGGALLGGIAGALLGGGDRRSMGGALIGAAAGGMLAYLYAYGKCFSLFSDLNSYPVAGYQETIRNEGYRPEQGDVVKIKSWTAMKKEVQPGEKLQFNGSYYILSPRELKEVKVIERRTISYFDPSKGEWTELGPPVDREITAALDTRNADGMVEVPKETPEGKYRIELKIIALGKEDSASAEYIVKKATAMERLFKFFALRK